jgi:hypothetical protein
MLTVFTFAYQTGTWVEHSTNNTQAIERQTAQVRSAIAITSAVEDGGTCTNFTAQVGNTGRVPIHDFSEMDLVVEYTDTSDAKVAAWLTHSTDWSVTGISPDTRDPNDWNPAETATIDFALPSAMKATANGTIMLATPLGITDSNYFDCT